jgi:hypothetical protein
MRKVLETSVLMLDKYGRATANNHQAEQYRISVYFDYEQDNHHVQFKADDDRRSIAESLRDLAVLIDK